MKRIVLSALTLLLTYLTSLALNIHWPTPNKAFFENGPEKDFIQPSSSGKIVSGKFGCTRNNGKAFHEGLDIKPLRRDHHGEATDEIYSIMEGKVVHVSRGAGSSNYGKYIVIQHYGVKPSICTLYAHLKDISPDIHAGTFVEGGTVLGIMGRTSSNVKIPKNRTHLHFEMGLMITDNFDSWYEAQKYQAKNIHGMWNGRNIQGFNPLDFFTQLRAGKVTSMEEYLKNLPIAFKIRVYDRKIPDFIKRYPSLLINKFHANNHFGWEIGFTWFGLPTQWKSLEYNETIRNNPTQITLAAYDKEVLQATACKNMICFDKSGQPQLGSSLKTLLSLLFEF